MRTCKEVSELVSQARQRPLSLRERGAVRLHLLLCRGCAHFARQVEFLCTAARQYASHGIDAVQQLSLGAEARERIRRNLVRQA